MTTSEIVACAPWRLPQARPLTSYEWSVVYHAINRGAAASGGYSNDTNLIATQVTGALRGQSYCPAWNTSLFGPAPAVATYAFECLGGWLRSLDPFGRTKALGDIAYGGLLCQANPPWQLCGAVRQGHASMLWEGGLQQGSFNLAPGTIEACAFPRARTAYVPLTGAQLLELVKSLRGFLPPELEPLAALGLPLLQQRSFLVGFQMRQDPTELLRVLASPSPNMAALAKAAFEDVALVWAPQKGASILFLVDGADPAKIMALVQMILPDLIGTMGVPDLTGLLGTVLQQLPNFFPTHGLGAVESSTARPGTLRPTGYDVVDLTGNEVAAEDRTPPGFSDGSGLVSLLLIAAGLVGAGATFTLVRRWYQARAAA